MARMAHAPQINLWLGDIARELGFRVDARSRNRARMAISI
jgi:hypothetical protein